MKSSKCIAILFICMPVFLFGHNLIVDQNGNGDCDSIREGIDNANSGPNFFYSDVEGGVSAFGFIEGFQQNLLP